MDKLLSVTALILPTFELLLAIGVSKTVAAGETVSGVLCDTSISAGLNSGVVVTVIKSGTKAVVTEKCFLRLGGGSGNCFSSEYVSEDEEGVAAVVETVATVMTEVRLFPTWDWASVMLSIWLITDRFVRG